MVMMANVILISCVKTKLPHSAPARQLYTSELFKKMRSYASSQGDRWYILSAKHGLLDPRDTIDPYDETLNTMLAAERKAWAERVYQAMTKRTIPTDTITILAGRRYFQDLLPKLRDRGHTVHLPLEGMGIGQRLSWLKQANEGI